MSIPFPIRFVALLISGVVAAGFLLSEPAIADDAEKPKTKKKPIKLAATKVRPENATLPASTPTVDLTSLPVLEIDPALPAHLQPVRLYNKDGRHLDARLISATSERVTVQRLTDNQTFDLPMESLDAASVDAVDSWMDRGMEMQPFSLDFQVGKRMVESDSFSVGGRDFKQMKWAYDVVMTNQSRNELNDAVLEYQIFFDDEVQVVRTSASPGKGKNMRDGQDVKLPALAFNGRAEFTTPPVDLQTYEYKPSRGEREFRRDQIVGIWIRVIKEGEVVGEYQSHPSLKDLPWNEDEEIEIIVRDSFEEQFED